MIFFYLPIFLLLLPSHSSSIILHCEFRSESPTIYECYAKCLEITSKTDRNITGIIGAHSLGKTNENVNSFRALNQIIEYFPHGLEKIFKNLKHFHIWKSNLREITSDDLKPFDLIELDLFDNKIEILEDDLFKNSTEIEIIRMASNEIRKVENGTFDGLKNLRMIDLDENLCYDEDEDHSTFRFKSESEQKKHAMEIAEEIEERCENWVPKVEEDKSGGSGVKAMESLMAVLIVLSLV